MLQINDIILTSYSKIYAYLNYKDLLINTMSE